jgi:ferric-dicitrate binding protein FerR (iron transport regulator)
MSNDFPLLLDQIRALLDAASDDEAGLAEMENTLTDGCARALLLETERVRIEKRIAELARCDGDPIQLEELRSLSERRVQGESELTRLRALLELLRQRIHARRAVALR